MLLKSIRAQMNIMFRKHTAVGTFYIMLLFVLCNYIENVLQYRGSDVISLYHPAKLLLLSDENINSPYGYYLMQFYPILAVLPAGFSLMVDKKSNQMLFLCARVGNRNYYIGKIIAALCTTVLVISIPLLLEVILNYVSFPKGAVGNLLNRDVYSDEYIAAIKTFPFYSIYLLNPYIYVIGWIFLFGITTGMLNVIVIAISTFVIPYKILLFLPIYVFLNALYWIGNFFGNNSINYFFLLRMFVINETNYMLFYGLIVGLFVVSVILIMRKSKTDYLG